MDEFKESFLFKYYLFNLRPDQRLFVAIEFLYCFLSVKFKRRSAEHTIEANKQSLPEKIWKKLLGFLLAEKETIKNENYKKNYVAVKFLFDIAGRFF